jgi:excisionase family DNA binding protein
MLQKRNQKSVFTTSEAARICHISPSTLFRAIRNKQIKAFTTPGGHFRIAKEDLDQFLVQSGMPPMGTAVKRRRVLIVEDNIVELRLMKRLLEKEPQFDVKSTESGFEAGFLVKTFVPDLLILDIYLKDMDGREVIRLIRSDADLEKTRIVVVSGVKDPKELADIRKTGIQELITKPIDPKTFAQKVQSFL